MLRFKSFSYIPNTIFTVHVASIIYVSLKCIYFMHKIHMEIVYAKNDKSTFKTNGDRTNNYLMI